MLVLDWKERAFIEKVNSRCIFWRPYWCTKRVHQYGVSIENSTKVREMFRQITQKLWATKIWDLDKLFIYKSFITIHFLGFFHWTVSNLFFLLCDRENNLHYYTQICYQICDTLSPYVPRVTNIDYLKIIIHTY